MRIGIDTRPLHDDTGIGRYSRGLVRALLRGHAGNHRWFFIGPKLDGDFGVPTTAVEPLTSGRWFETIEVPLRLAARGIETFISTCCYVPPRVGCRTLFVLHDLTPYTMGECHPAPSHRYMVRHLGRYLLAADRVITVSRAERENILAAFPGMPRLSDKLAVVENGVDAATFPASIARDRVRQRLRELGIAGDYLLFVGTIEPRKNLSRLGAVFNDALVARTGLRLVIAGKRGWVAESDYARLAANPHVTLTGYVDDPTLALLYHGAAAVINPSLAEGFGLPLAEAMACGRNILASDLPVFREVTGGAMWYFDPRDPDRIRETIFAWHRDPERARPRFPGGAERYTWPAAAAKLAALIESE